MIGKHELYSYRDDLMELRQIEGRIEQIKTSMYSLRSPNMSGMPHAQNTDPGSAQERAADQMSEEKKRLVAIYEAKAAALDAKCLEVEAALDLLPSRFRHLLRARYIEGQKWQEIADAAPYSFERCMQLHRRALAMLRDRQQKST